VTDPFRLCLIGLPKTGKTTYLAALWSYLRSDLPGDQYRITELPENTAYLDAISYAWAAGETMPRSGPEVSDHIEFTIEVPDRPPLQVVLPDLPGEVFLNAVRRPVIDEGTGTAVLNSDLLLLFVNCRSAWMFEPLGDHPVDPMVEGTEPPPPANEWNAGAVPEVEPTAGDDDATGNGEGEHEVDGGPAAHGFKEFNIGELDTDTLNYELIERLGEFLADAGFPPLLIVVSAWDVYASPNDVADEVFTPDNWLRDHQPMLWQRIEELRRTMTIGVVGVSAQGADYQDRPEIVEADVQVRAWGSDADGGKTDIVGPLLWYHALPAPNG
jgi:hypothetical protein